jgi:N-acetyl-anhydromuramyl-L-alanine amidase AmpD
VIFTPAFCFKRGRVAPINLIVLHTMEWAETPTTATGCAAMFASPEAKGSAHYCVDATGVIQCVRDADTAWHTRGGDVNDRSIGIELAGFAKQTVEDWNDRYSVAMLEHASALVAALCLKYSIPLAYLLAEHVKEGKSGVTTHRECSKAFNIVGGHSDPGPNFPMGTFLIKVDSYIAYPE